MGNTMIHQPCNKISLKRPDCVSWVNASGRAVLTLYSQEHLVPWEVVPCHFGSRMTYIENFWGQHNVSLNKMKLSDCVSWVNASGGAVPADAWVAWAGDGGGRGREQVILWSRPFCNIFHKNILHPTYSD